MAALSRSGYERLLRWYPRAWRSRWAAVVIGTFEEDDAARGVTGPTRARARSIRAGGTVERLAASTVGLGVASMIAALLGSAAYLVAITQPSVTVPFGVLSLLVSPSLAVLCALGLLARGGLLEARAVLVSAVLSVLALLTGTAASMAWSVGFDEADAGRPQSFLARLLVPLLCGAWALGTAAAAPLLMRLVGGRSPSPVRAMLAAGAAALAALAIGVLLVVQQSAPLSAGVVLALALAMRHRHRHRPHAVPVPAAPGPSRTAPPARWSTRTVVVLAAASTLLGTAALTLAFTGGVWPGSALDGTEAMNAGLALAALAALPLVAAAGHLLRRRPRYRRSPAALLLTGALGASCAAQAVGASADAQWPLMLLAAAFVGATASSLLHPVLPLQGGVRLGIAVLAGMAAAASIGTVLGVLLPVLAPPAALALLVVSSISTRRGRSSSAAPAA